MHKINAGYSSFKFLLDVSKYMLSYRARLRNTSNALTFRMFGKQIRLQFPPKLFGANSWIVQMIRQ